MKICHVTPHLPPDQAANALLPFHLGCWARESGGEAVYVAYAARMGSGGRAPELPGPVTWIPSDHNRRGIIKTMKLARVIAAARIMRLATPAVEEADIVHLHSNGLLTEVVSMLAARKNKPVVMTLYGTEIWHYRPKRWGPDLFTRAYRRAAHVTFYSEALQQRAITVGLARRETSIIYPLVAPQFERRNFAGQSRARAELGLRNQHILVNVKRLHPLAGQRYLIEALGEVIRTHPDTRLIVCGTGPLLDDLKAAARSAGVEGHVTFAGLVDNRAVARYDMAADVFVLPSLLEACPTVALEALACGTPVISSDNPGGMELNDLFGIDVAIVPKENAMALARAIVELLDNKRRARGATADLIEREFRPAAVAGRFAAVYDRALQRRAESPELVPADQAR